MAKQLDEGERKELEALRARAQEFEQIEASRQESEKLRQEMIATSARVEQLTIDLRYAHAQLAKLNEASFSRLIDQPLQRLLWIRDNIDAAVDRHPVLVALAESITAVTQRDYNVDPTLTELGEGASDDGAHLVMLGWLGGPVELRFKIAWSVVDRFAEMKERLGKGADKVPAIAQEGRESGSHGDVWSAIDDVIREAIPEVENL